MNVTASLAASFLVLLAAVCAAQVPASRPQDPAALREEGLKALVEHGITLDLAKKTVTIDAIVNAPPDPIEYVLVHRRGKSHEAMFLTEVKPTSLNAALIMLGFEPGKNADYKEKNPLPSLEEVEKGAPTVDIIHPEGMPVWMTVSFARADANADAKGDAKPDAKPDAKTETKTETKTDAKGDATVTLPLEDLLIDIQAQRTVTAQSWVFLGGRHASLYKGEPEVFVADFEGNLVSCCYLLPHNHLVTMKHERSPDDQNWWIADAMPPPGTKARFTFHREMPQVSKDRETRVQEELKKQAASRPAGGAASQPAAGPASAPQKK